MQEKEVIRRLAALYRRRAAIAEVIQALERYDQMTAENPPIPPVFRPARHRHACGKRTSPRA